MQDALNIITAMFNMQSAHNISLVNIPITNMSALGMLADKLLTIFPVGIVGYAIQFAAIACAFGIVSCRNSLEIVKARKHSMVKVLTLSIVMVMGLYMTLHTTSPVFLYFNF